MTDTTTDQGTVTANSTNPVAAADANAASATNDASIQGAPVAQTGSTQAALENIAQNNPVPEAPISSAVANAGYNDSKPTTEDVQAQNAELLARVSNLELILQRFFQSNYRMEGYVNDDGSFNLDD